jgi:hypothetical protein
MARRRWRANQAIPAVGVIDGGRMDGWRYAFLRFEQNARGHFDVVAFCTPPAWPFGREIVCTWERARRFKAVPGERAKRMAIEPLMLAAERLAAEQRKQA